MKTADDLLQFLDERTEELRDRCALGQLEPQGRSLRWDADPRGGVAGAWVLTVGAHDRVLHGVSRADRAEALERSRRFVAEYMSSVSHHYVD